MKFLRNCLLDNRLLFQENTDRYSFSVDVITLEDHIASSEADSLDILLDQSQKRNGLRWYQRLGNPNETFTDHCDRCAIVTSAGVLLGSKAGKRIDSYQCVVRMNGSPTTGFEQDVGKKLTHRLVLAQLPV